MVTLILRLIVPITSKTSLKRSGMLGFGHNAEFLEQAVSAPQCMANIMTPSFSQHSFYEEFVKHVGFTRQSGNPYQRVFAMNSGSEAVELSARLTDTHAKLMTDPGAVHQGRRSTIIVLEGSFYGRTYVHSLCFRRVALLHPAASCALARETLFQIPRRSIQPQLPGNIQEALGQFPAC
jgi:adenosylmethionine-8-amino-7-oxononanoate aminotransferase